MIEYAHNNFVGISLLSETIGIELILEEQESAVGGFYVDLFASEEGTGRKVIIENQLEDTDHDHLGKAITYASGKGTQVIIWVVKRPGMNTSRRLSD